MNVQLRPQFFIPHLVWCLGALLPLPTWAEKADADKPTQIDAQHGQYNDLKQTGWYEGNVVLVKGSLRIEGARLDFRKDPEGYEYAVVAGAAGHPAAFRQRRDRTQPGVEEHVEGSADRIEYDSKAETVKLIGHANWRRLENQELRDEINGSQILYDSRNATYEAAAEGNATSGPADAPRNRVRTVIAPRRDATASSTTAPATTAPATTTPAPAPATAAPTPLKPATTLKAPKP